MGCWWGVGVRMWRGVGVWGRCWGVGVVSGSGGVSVGALGSQNVVGVLGCWGVGVSECCWGVGVLLGVSGCCWGVGVLSGCCWGVIVLGCVGPWWCRGAVGSVGAVLGCWGVGPSWGAVGRCGAAVGRCRPPPYQVQAGALQYVHQLLEPRPRREDEVVVHPQDVFGAHLGDGQVPPREPALCHGSAPQPGRTTSPRPIQPPPHITAPAPHSPRPIEPPPHRAPAP